MQYMIWAQATNGTGTSGDPHCQALQTSLADAKRVLASYAKRDAMQGHIVEMKTVCDGLNYVHGECYAVRYAGDWTYYWIENADLPYTWTREAGAQLAAGGALLSADETWRDWQTEKRGESASI